MINLLGLCGHQIEGLAPELGAVLGLEPGLVSGLVSVKIGTQAGLASKKEAG